MNAAALPGQSIRCPAIHAEAGRGTPSARSRCARVAIRAEVRFTKTMCMVSRLVTTILSLSFIQSRMFHAGVTCSDCHEPHSLGLRGEGNGVCMQCHCAQKYDSVKHHFHRIGSPGALCVECHMPSRTYMVVDPRRDHSLRIPRPDLSVELGLPNACNNCHADKSAQWALNSVDKWYGLEAKGFQRFAETLHAGSVGAPSAQQSLDQLVSERDQPAIARA